VAVLFALFVGTVKLLLVAGIEVELVLEVG